MRGNERAGKTTNLAAIARVAHNELQELVRKRAEMNQRIVVLRKSIRALLSKEAVRNTQLNRAIKLFGLSLASAVFLDAFVIRSLLLPSVLELLGRRTWKFPDWLSRRLPRVALDEPAPLPPKPALEEA